MFFRQYYLECLSHASYLIGDTGTAGRWWSTRGATSTSTSPTPPSRADDRAGPRDPLPRRLPVRAPRARRATGATIVYGAAAEGGPSSRSSRSPTASASSSARRHGVTWRSARHPGHTPESISIVIYDGAGDPYGVLTGDTLFIGDVGRPDLLASVGVTADELARQLYHSLHDRLLTLPDATKVFPAHGAGSACGKNLSTETVSTIGEQRRPTTRSPRWARTSSSRPSPRASPRRRCTSRSPPTATASSATCSRTGPRARAALDEVLAQQHDGRRGDRRTRRHRLRPRPLARVDQRRSRRPVRRVRGRGHAAGTPIVLVTAARTRGRGQGASRPHRLRRRASARSASRSARFVAHPTLVEPALPAHRRHPRRARMRRAARSSCWSTSATPARSTLGMIPGARHIRLPALLEPPRRARSASADRRLLRRRLPIGHRGQPAALARLQRRVRPDRRLHRLGQSTTPHPGVVT